MKTLLPRETVLLNVEDQSNCGKQSEEDMVTKQGGKKAMKGSSLSQFLWWINTTQSPRGSPKEPHRIHLKMISPKEGKLRCLSTDSYPFPIG